MKIVTKEDMIDQLVDGNMSAEQLEKIGAKIAAIPEKDRHWEDRLILKLLKTPSHNGGKT